MTEPPALATDLAAWREETEQALRPLLQIFESTFGYPPGDNVVEDAIVGDAGRGDLPPALQVFYEAIGEVSLPDIGNGHSIHARKHVLCQLREHGVVRVTDSVEGVVFGSNR